MIDRIALTLLIIGGLNWGSIGIFQFDLVGFIGGGQTGVVSRIIYILVAHINVVDSRFVYLSGYVS